MCEVFSTSSSHSGLIHRDNSAIGVSNETGIGSISISGSIGNGPNMTGVDTAIHSSVVGQMGSTGSGHSGFVSGNNGTVGVRHQGKDSSKGASVSISSSISNSSKSSIDSAIDTTMVGQMVSTSSSDGGLISGDNGTIGVRH